LSTPTATGISRRTWRAAVIVFLTVLLTGTTLTGAAALWSVQGTATARVETGYWVERNFDLGLSVTATRWRDGDTSRLRGVTLTWTPAPNNKPPQGVEVTYKVEGKGLGKGLGALNPTKIESGLPYEGTPPLQIQITRPSFLQIPEWFEITITPYIDGIAGKPSTHEFRYDYGGTIYP
jgi:hypothetical protein